MFDRRRAFCVDLMGRIRTRIAVTGLTYADIVEGLPHLRRHLRERAWLIEPRAGWDAEEGRLTLTIDSEGDDPRAASSAACAAVWDCVMAAFAFSSEGISCDLLEARVVA